jgi:hypothetical protein
MKIKNLNKDEFFSIFNNHPHIFLSKEHIDVHLNETEKCMFLTNDDLTLGIILKNIDSKTYSPYSAPFGGFYSKDNRIYHKTIDLFVNDLCNYLINIGICSLNIIFPPILYSTNITSKFINSIINLVYIKKIIPDINNHIEFKTFKDFLYHKNTEKLIRKATRAGLSLHEVFDDKKIETYNIIKDNRMSKFRSLSLTFEKLIALDDICGTRYFIVKDSTEIPLAAAIIFKVTPDTMYAQYWGDNDEGRKLNAMDYLSSGLVNLFKKEGYAFFDVGISSENGIPNSGLLRFKESHLFKSTLRFTIDINFV